jgi:hypothetical protein
MSRRYNTKLIKTESKEIFTSESRSAEIELPVFSFAGEPEVNVLSGPYVPGSDIRLTKWQISAGIVGTGLNDIGGSFSFFNIFIGDNILSPDGVIVANGALEGGELVPWFGDSVVKPEGPYSYKSNYSLDGYSGRDGIDVARGIGLNEHILVSTRQWIKVSCTLSCGHEDIVIKIFGQYVNQSNDSGNPNIEF